MLKGTIEEELRQTETHRQQTQALAEANNAALERAEV